MEIICDDDLLWQRLLEVVRKVDADNYGYEKEFFRSTRVIEDLHLLGDPAGDLLNAIVEEFKVDFSSFPFKRYFLEEGFFPIPLFFWKTEKLRVINLGMLEQAVRLGRWDTQLIDPD